MRKNESNRAKELSDLAQLRNGNSANLQQHHDTPNMSEIRLDYDCYCFRYFDGAWGVEAYYVVTTGTPNPNSYDMKSHWLTAEALHDLLKLKVEKNLPFSKEKEALTVLANRNGGYPSKRPASYYVYAPPFNRL